MKWSEAIIRTIPINIFISFLNVLISISMFIIPYRYWQNIPIGKLVILMDIILFSVSLIFLKLSNVKDFPFVLSEVCPR